MNKILKILQKLSKLSNHNVSQKLNETENNIYAKKVSSQAIIGTHINVMQGTSIDENCRIDSFTYIGYYCFITKAEIGRYCSIANHVSIGGGEHKLGRISTSSRFYEDPYKELTEKKCIIGNDVWIGTQSIIRRGVVIGNGAVIGANSFVTKEVPDFAVAVGSPAKIIKYRFPPEQIEMINASNWWDLELEEAKKIIKGLQMSSAFVGSVSRTCFPMLRSE